MLFGRLQQQRVLQPPRDRRSALQHDDEVHSRQEAGHVPSTVRFSDRYVQIGKWRFGDVDGKHFSVLHDNGKIAQVYTADGGRLGANHEITTRYRDDVAPAGIKFGDRFVQIGNFRICDVDGTHASICTLDGKTSQIFRKDGTLHPARARIFAATTAGSSPATRRHRWSATGTFRSATGDWARSTTTTHL